MAPDARTWAHAGAPERSGQRASTSQSAIVADDELLEALTSESAHVDVYVPAKVLAGKARRHVGVTVRLPIPVLAVALTPPGPVRCAGGAHPGPG
jgi:hypothetical protein